MERTKDLDAALRFITGRVEEQATRSGQPLNDEQRLLLRYLPIGPTSYPHGVVIEFVPRNLDLELLCALAKQAYSENQNVSPSTLDWEFALAVFKLNRHPMAGFLQQAGVKYRRPWWDGFLLVGAALLVIAGGMALIFFLGDSTWASYQWAAYSVGFVVILTVVYFGSRRIENSQLLRDVERCRERCRFI